MMDKILPQPCNGPLYDGLPPDAFLDKVQEEVDELDDELAKFTHGHNNFNEVCLEVTDAITALTTLLDRIGCNEHMRQEYQRRVNDSNAKRDGGRRVKQKYGKELK